MAKSKSITIRLTPEEIKLIWLAACLTDYGRVSGWAKAVLLQVAGQKLKTAKKKAALR